MAQTHLKNGKKPILQLQKQKFDVICIKNPHMKRADQKLLECSRLGKLFVASDISKKKKGMAMYIKKELEPKLIFTSDKK